MVSTPNQPENLPPWLQIPVGEEKAEDHGVLEREPNGAPASVQRAQDATPHVGVAGPHESTQTYLNGATPTSASPHAAPSDVSSFSAASPEPSATSFNSARTARRRRRKDEADPSATTVDAVLNRTASLDTGRASTRTHSRPAHAKPGDSLIDDAESPAASLGDFTHGEQSSMTSSHFGTDADPRVPAPSSSFDYSTDSEPDPEKPASDEATAARLLAPESTVSDPTPRAEPPASLQASSPQPLSVPPPVTPEVSLDASSRVSSTSHTTEPPEPPSSHAPKPRMDTSPRMDTPQHSPEGTNGYLSPSLRRQQAASSGRPYVPSQTLPSMVTSNTPVPPPILASDGTTVTSAAAKEKPGAPAVNKRQPVLDQSILVNPVKPAPTSGWRKFLYAISGGHINVGDSKKVAHQQRLVELATTPLRGDYRIAVMSMKGGVGKTTTSVMLGGIFASLRGDRVIAIDANPDFGTLAQRAALPDSPTIRDLLNATDVGRYSNIRAYTTQADSRLEVIGSERDPEISEAFSEKDYRKAIEILQQHYNVILTDCGTGVMHSAMPGVLDLANTLILVTSPALDGAQSASATLDWLNHHGYEDLSKNAIVVIASSNSGSATSDVRQLTEYFKSRARAVQFVPFDRHLAEGAVIDLKLLDRRTYVAYLELAALVAQDFAHWHRPA